MPPLGFSQPQWDCVKEEIRQILIACAQAQGGISYSELVRQVRTIQFEPRDERLFTMLGEISAEEDAAGRGMLSAVVVHKRGDMQPGTGFFKLAAKLGRNTIDPEKCWIEELNRVYAQWRSPTVEVHNPEPPVSQKMMQDAGKPIEEPDPKLGRVEEESQDGGGWGLPLVSMLVVLGDRIRWLVSRILGGQGKQSA